MQISECNAVRSLSCRCGHWSGFVKKKNHKSSLSWKIQFPLRHSRLLLWRLMFWGRLLGRHCWSWPWRSGDSLVLPLPVSYNCAQKQRNDGHEVQIPFRPQKLVHVKMQEHLFDLHKEGDNIILFSNAGKRSSHPPSGRWRWCLDIFHFNRLLLLTA